MGSCKGIVVCFFIHEFQSWIHTNVLNCLIHRLLVIHRQLLIIHLQLLVIHRQLFVIRCQLLVIHRQLLVTQRQLLVTQRQLLVIQCQSLVVKRQSLVVQRQVLVVRRQSLVIHLQSLVIHRQSLVIHHHLLGIHHHLLGKHRGVHSTGGGPSPPLPSPPLPSHSHCPHVTQTDPIRDPLSPSTGGGPPGKCALAGDLRVLPRRVRGAAVGVEVLRVAGGAGQCAGGAASPPSPRAPESALPQ
jgi:hypothetical protein